MNACTDKTETDITPEDIYGRVETSITIKSGTFAEETIAYTNNIKAKNSYANSTYQKSNDMYNTICIIDTVPKNTQLAVFTSIIRLKNFQPSISGVPFGKESNHSNYTDTRATFFSVFNKNNIDYILNSEDDNQALATITNIQFKEHAQGFIKLIGYELNAQNVSGFILSENGQIENDIKFNINVKIILY